MTADEQRDLHEQANDLAYLAIRYANLSPMLSCDEWDGLAEKIGKRAVEFILREVYAVKDAREGEEAKMDEWLAST